MERKFNISLAFIIISIIIVSGSLCYGFQQMKKVKYLDATFKGKITNDEDYSKYVVPRRMTKIQKNSGKGFKEKIVYLGDINVNGQLFYVLTSFKVTQAAITKHGHSTIYILDLKKKLAKQYYISLPEELPFKIENNSLYFHYQDEKTKEIKTYINKIENELPKFMCVEPENCY